MITMSHPHPQTAPHSIKANSFVVPKSTTVRFVRTHPHFRPTKPLCGRIVVFVVWPPVRRFRCKLPDTQRSRRQLSPPHVAIGSPATKAAQFRHRGQHRRGAVHGHQDGQQHDGLGAN